jgi:hypothetical protein
VADAAHAFWSPSGFKQLAACPGSQALQAGLPDTTSVYAAEGTAAHQLFTWALTEELQASDWLGDEIHVNAKGRVTSSKADAEWSFEVDEEMASNVQVAIDFIRGQCDDGEDVLLVDQRVNFAAYLGVPEDTAWGTLDAAVVQVARKTLVVQDLKYGRGVQVEAGSLVENATTDGAPVPNDQMALYALGILSAVESFAEIDDVLLVISQPRTQSEPSTFRLSVAELKEWAEGYAKGVVWRAARASEVYSTLAPSLWAAAYLFPGEDQCRFCRAKATCPALRAEVADTIVIQAASPDDFADARIPGPEFIQPTSAEWLAAALGKVDLIEGWCAAVRAEVERRLLAGQVVPGYKVVAGRMGARSWADPVAAEDLLRKQFRLPVEKVYDLKLISPTTAEKLAKAGDIGPRQWKIAEAQITRRDGKPHVAPVTDKRPALAIVPVAGDFDTATEDFS